MQQIRHECTGLELLRGRQPMAHPFGRGGIVASKQNGRRATLEALDLILAGGMTSETVQFGDEYFSRSNLLQRGVPRKPFKARNNGLRHREQRQARCN